MVCEQHINTEQLLSLTAEGNLLEEANPHLIKLNYGELTATWKEQVQRWALPSQPTLLPGWLKWLTSAGASCLGTAGAASALQPQTPPCALGTWPSPAQIPPFPNLLLHGSQQDWNSHENYQGMRKQPGHFRHTAGWQGQFSPSLILALEALRCPFNKKRSPAENSSFRQDAQTANTFKAWVSCKPTQISSTTRSLNHLWKYSVFHNEAVHETKLSLERDFTEDLFKNIKAKFGLKSTPQHKSFSLSV